MTSTEQIAALEAELAETPGAVSVEDLPHMVLLAADEREMHGDYGAARMLTGWAEMLARPVGEWD